MNCIDYYPGGDKPYLISGADDKTVRIWDYQTKACVQQLEGHTNNVCSCLFHPRLPILVSASEDGTVRIWHATTYRAETTLNYGMERAWALAVTASSNKLAIGYDDGTIMITLGNEVGSREDDGTFSFSGGGGGGGIDRAPRRFERRFETRGARIFGGGGLVPLVARLVGCNATATRLALTMTPPPPPPPHFTAASRCRSRQKEPLRAPP